MVWDSNAMWNIVSKTVSKRCFLAQLSINSDILQKVVKEEKHDTRIQSQPSQTGLQPDINERTNALILYNSAKEMVFNTAQNPLKQKSPVFSFQKFSAWKWKLFTDGSNKEEIA